MAEIKLAMKLFEGALPGMFNLGDVLQLVIDCFYQGPLSQQDFVRYIHQKVFHVDLHLGYQLYVAREEVLEQSLTDVSLVRTELALYVLLFRNSACFSG